MKFNLKAFSLASVSALALLASPFVITHAVHAEGGRRGHALEQLNLTDVQSSQIEAIRDSAKAQMQIVLTAEQQATLANSEGRGRRALRQLDLSEAQREQLRAIREGSRTEISSVLTAEQQAQLEQMRSEHEGRRGEGRRNGREG